MKLEQRLRRLSVDERRRVISVLRELLEEDDRIVFAHIHGSMLEEGPVRDVDVAVWLREGVDPLEYAVEEGLRIELRLKLPADIQILNIAPTTFRYMVYTRGAPLVVKDRRLHDLEEAKTLQMYSDLVALRKKEEVLSSTRPSHEGSGWRGRPKIA